MSQPDTQILERLYDLLLERRKADPDSSYVASLYAKGRDRILQKVGEEAVETIIAGKGDDDRALVMESADLIFHLWVMLAERGLEPEVLYAELERRFGHS
ncbi:MAG: phosphoribosyl-ATP diphosphatase, partial [Magnetococcales bacterium]|nr:phosphoribosyl-ATP diphosphatase [Magnetococcales bacterium]